MLQALVQFILMKTDAFCYFHAGVLVIEGGSEVDQLPSPWRWLHGKWRTEGYRYEQIRPWLADTGIADHIRRWQPLNYTLSDSRPLHDYQQQAIEAWKSAGMRGSVVLPTGSGKSLVAVHAIHAVNRSAVVVCPTLALLMQWHRLLSNMFSSEVGVYYGAEKIQHPLMVTTFNSLGNMISEYGSHFLPKLLVLDEAHHMTSPSFGEGALMAPAPYRLGLTATYPSENEQGEGRWRLDDLIGPIVFSLTIDDLSGEYLALYRTQRYRVSLTQEEQRLYEQDHATYIGFVERRRLRDSHKEEWLNELMRLSARDPEARAALLARQRIARLLAGCQGKIHAVETLLREHLGEQVLIFTDQNEIAYSIARQFLIPAISHTTTAAERREILDGFQQRRYSAIVTSHILDEGVDVPQSKVAVILGGSVGARQYVQRLGRILRKVENRQAVLYEVIVRGTTEEGKAQRRRAAVLQQGGAHAYRRPD
jgi:superfamily II DNA or RNA helicase